MEFLENEVVELKSKVVDDVCKEIIAFANTNGVLYILVPKIMSAYAGSGLEPKIEVSNNAFKITLPNLNYMSRAEILDGLLTREEKHILALIDTKDVISRNEVYALLGVSQATSSRILKKMVDKKLIIQEGNGKNTRYVGR